MVAIMVVTNQLGAAPSARSDGLVSMLRSLPRGAHVGERECCEHSPQLAVG